MSCVNKSDKNYIRLAERYGDNIAESIVRAISKTKGLVEEFHIPSIFEAKNFLKTVNSNKLQKIKRGLKSNPYLTEKGIVDYLQGVIAKFENEYFVVKGFSYGITSKEAATKEIFEPNLEIVKTIALEYPDIFKIQETKKEQTVIVKITPREQLLEVATPVPVQDKLFQETGKIQQLKLEQEEKEEVIKFDESDLSYNRYKFLQKNPVSEDLFNTLTEEEKKVLIWQSNNC